jgi:hypothetical protein
MVAIGYASHFVAFGFRSSALSPLHLNNNFTLQHHFRSRLCAHYNRMFWGIERFHYTPINAQNEFRLLHLAPRYASTWQYATSFLLPNKPISCVLEEVSLKGPPKYSALSYRWGGSGRQILVNGKHFTVTDKLEIALQHLQQDWKPLTLWVDAICINQQDTDEKTQQVRQMTDIYRRASQVLIWLGPEADGSDQVIDCLQLISQVCQKQDLRKSMKYISEASSWRVLADHLTDVIRNLEAAKATGDQTDVHAIETLENGFKNGDSPFLDGFPFAQYTKLCHREWWSRTWVIQELCVPEMPIFVCGKKMISYHDFANCGSFLTTYWWHKLKRGYLNRSPNEEPDPTSAWSLGSSPASTMMQFRYLYQDSKGKCTLYSLIRTLCGNTSINAEDPRDKIFSLLGFVSDKDKLNIRIDYGKSYSPKDVYIDTSRALLEQGHLEMLSLRQTSKSPDLPSWVCDWSAEVHRPWGNPTGIDQPFIASGRSIPKVHVYTANNGQHIVTIRTKLVDALSSLASPAPKIDRDSDNSDAITFFISETRRILGQLSDEDMAAILTGDLEYIGIEDQSSMLPDRRRVTSKSSEALALLEKFLPVKKEFEELRSLEGTQATDETQTRWSNILPLIDGLQGLNSGLMTRFMEAVSENLGRKAFCGQRGYKGLVPAEAEVGDLLCVFLGANLPSVVRKVEGGRYRLVGEAYIHGFMDGELMKVAGDQVTLELC